MHFCITGTGRCGSKLLRNLFNLHPDLYVHDETHWIPKMFEFFGTGEADVDALIEIIRRTYHVTGVPVTPLNNPDMAIELASRKRMTVAEFCDVVGRSFARRHGKTIWADKTPDYGPYMQTLQMLWPGCRFVHLIRHGLEVADSMSRHPGYRWMASAGEMWWCPASFNRYYKAVRTRRCSYLDFIDLWYWRLLRIQNEATRLHPGSYLEIRLEELIVEPEPTLKKIASFVGITSPEDWLSQAAGLIDVSRLHSRSGNIPGDDLEVRHRNLLNSLGYH